MQACPSSIEYKSTSGDTPLWLAFRFGRADLAQILIKAGANQMVRNNSGDNIIHAALGGSPQACRLRPILDLVDSGIIAHLFQQRNNLHESGTTPLHSWITHICGTNRYYQWRTYKNDGQVLRVLSLILEYSKGLELEMLNGAGDTPLHTAVMSHHALFAKALLDHKPKLLYRENAVGRTPAEVARELVTGEKFTAPGVITLSYNSYNNDKEPAALVKRDAGSFVKESEDDDDRETLSDKQRVWAVIRAVLEKFQEKRRLVSLNEANDVAKRLGEKYSGSRYFSIQGRVRQSARDDGSDAGDNDGSQDDFAAISRRGASASWWFREDDSKPQCDCCEQHHD